MAQDLGLSPSRVQGWYEAGLQPAHAVSRKELLAHFQALDELTGTGRDAEVAIIKMAARGFQCARLRESLLGLQDFDPSHAISDADELVQVADPLPMAYLQRSAERLGVPPGFRNEPGLAPARAGAAVLALAQTAVGEPIGPRDFVDLDELLNEPVARLAGVDPSEVPTDLEGTAALSRRIVEVVTGSAQRWFDEASDDDFLAGVTSARRVVDALKILGLEFGGDEEEWITVGQVTPVAERMLASLTEDLQRLLPAARGGEGHSSG